MNETHHDAAHGTGHDPAAMFKAYIAVFIALCGLTAVSFVCNFLVQLGILSHTASAGLIMLVALIKAGCVIWIFMHLKQDWGLVYFIMVPVVIMGIMMMIVLMPDGVIGWWH